MILEIYLKVRINTMDLLIYNGLIERRSKEALEKLGSEINLFNRDTSEIELHEGERKLPLRYPVMITSELYTGEAYFAYKEDIVEFVLATVAVTGDVDYNSTLNAYELLDDEYRQIMNGYESEYFKGTLGDVIFEGCSKTTFLGREVALKEKEINLMAGVF